MLRKLVYLAALVLVLITVSPGLGGNPDPNLMVWWTLDSHTFDVSGNNRNGTIHGDPIFVPGVHGEALAFNGDD